MSAPDLIQGFYGSQGTLIGLSVGGFCAFPYSQGAGIAMQDSSGAWWLLTINTDGSLLTTQVTF